MNEIEQKEFEEMAALILKTSEEYYRAKCCEECADFEAMALYNAGYRKQSETVKEFADKIKASPNRDYSHSYQLGLLGLTENDINDLAEQFGKGN